MKVRIFPAIASLALSAQGLASTAYLENQYNEKLCKGRWSWTEVWTETKTIPAVTKDVEEKQTIRGQRPSTTKVEIKSENVSCFSSLTTCTPERARSLCDAKKASWSIAPEQVISSDFNVISNYVENVDRGGPIQKWRNVTASCSINFRPMESFEQIVSYDPPRFTTVEVSPAKTETASKSKDGSSALGKQFAQLPTLAIGHAYQTLVCSSGDHIANNTPESALQKFTFLTKQLDNFDKKAIDPNTCDESNEDCAEYRAIIRNYFAIIFEPIQSLLTLDQFIEISDRHRSSYSQVGYPEHLEEIVIDEPFFSSL